MDSNTYQDLMNSLSYGTVMRGDLPGDIDQYDIFLVRQTKQDSSVDLKLKFTPKKNHPNNHPFFITIDKVRKPSNAIVLIKYGEKAQKGQKEPKAFAKADVRIKRKMLLSVQKDNQQWQEIIDNDQQNENEDSDIPRRRIIHLNDNQMDDSMGDRDDSSVPPAGYRGRKRKHHSDDEDD